MDDAQRFRETSEPSILFPGKPNAWGSTIVGLALTRLETVGGECLVPATEENLCGGDESVKDKGPSFLAIASETQEIARLSSSILTFASAF
jgi:hypothetical protein